MNTMERTHTIENQEPPRIAAGVATILFPLLLTAGFALHPDLFTPRMTTTAAELVAKFHGKVAFHAGHTIVLAAVPFIIVMFMSVMAALGGRGRKTREHRRLDRDRGRGHPCRGQGGALPRALGFRFTFGTRFQRSLSCAPGDCRQERASRHLLAASPAADRRHHSNGCPHERKESQSSSGNRWDHGPRAAEQSRSRSHQHNRRRSVMRGLHPLGREIPSTNVTHLKEKAKCYSRSS